MSTSICRPGLPARPSNGQTACPPRRSKTIADTAFSEAERRAIGEALADAKGNKSQAARLLGTDYKTLHLKMRRYGINASASSSRLRAEA